MAVPTFTTIGQLEARLYEELIRHPNLQLLVPMNEASGAVLDRCVRNRLSGTVSGSPTRGVAIGNGFVGMAFNRATPNEVRFTAPSALNFGNNKPFTLLAVIDSLITTGNNTLVSMRDTSVEGGVWSWYAPGATRKPRLMLGGTTSGRSDVESDTALTNGTAAMIGVTVDGTGTVGGIKHYKDGPATSLTTIQNDLVGAGATQKDCVIGDLHNPSEGLTANGLGFVAIFNAVLTAREFKLYAHLGGFV